MSLIKDFISSETIGKLVEENTQRHKERYQQCVKIVVEVLDRGLTKLEKDLKQIMETGTYPNGWGLNACDCHGQEFTGNVTIDHLDVDGDMDETEFRMSISTDEAYVVTDYKSDVLKDALPLVKDVVFENGKFMRNGYEIRLRQSVPQPSVIARMMGIS